VNSPCQNTRILLSQRCEQRGVVLSGPQLDRLAAYLSLLRQWQRHLNLTGLRDVERLIEVLIVESLDFLHGGFLSPAARVLDLGTGAGVPGVTLAVCGPSLRLTLLDRSQKKITFLQRVVAHLGLRACQPEAASAEELARRLAPDARFDAVVTRGVGRVSHLLSLSAPLLRPGGVLLLRKPADTPELREAEPLLASDTWKDVRRIALPALPPPAWILLGFVKA
jgi:16S rRNA (guanine527-N7)-methyltransferase